MGSKMKSGRSKFMIRLEEERSQKEKKAPLKDDNLNYYESDEDCIPGTPGK